MPKLCLIPPWLDATEPLAQGERLSSGCLDELAKLPGISELLLEHRELSRLGHLDDAGLIESALEAKAKGLRIVLVWDLLATDPELAKQSISFASLLQRLPIDAVRAQDVGVARYLRQHFPALPLQLVLETGNHNLAGIRAWIRSLQPEKVVLSNELPLASIKRIRAAIETPVECLVFGRILIFHSPRKLLSPMEPERVSDPRLLRYITSEEDRKHFPIVENSHGTFMFYEKELLLLPYLGEIKSAGIEWVRLDLRFHERALIQPLAAYLNEANDAHLEGLKTHLPKRLTRGFFKSNRTDKQFAKLKNQHLVNRESEPFVGTVLETRKKEFMVLETQRALAVGDRLEILIPEGRFVTSEVAWLAKPGGQAQQSADQPGLWVMNTARGVSAGAKVFFAQIPEASEPESHPGAS